MAERQVPKVKMAPTAAMAAAAAAAATTTQSLPSNTGTGADCSASSSAAIANPRRLQWCTRDPGQHSQRAIGFGNTLRIVRRTTTAATAELWRADVFQLPATDGGQTAV